MSIESLLIGILVLSVAVFLTAAPLLRREPKFDLASAQIERQRERAQVYYARVLRNLRDIEEDHALGKLEDADYAYERSLWTERGVQILKALEKLDDGSLIAPASADDASIDQQLDSAVEAAIAAYREKRQSGPNNTSPQFEG